LEEKEIHIILDKVINGDIRAFEQLVDQHKNMVFSLCLKMLKNQQLAEEVAQDTFVKAYKSLKTFKRKSKFSTWLYQICYYTAITAIRNKKMQHYSDLDQIVLTNDEDPSKELELADNRVLITKALNELSPEEASVIELFYLKELDTKEVAQITKMSLSNVKVKIHRARKKLYHIINELNKKELSHG
jgi:RNA polymerase sigma-70 factor (ECF subfamily)